MASLISASDSNFTAAAWAQVDAAGLLDSEAGSTALTINNLDSANFVLAANEIDGFAVKLASRAAGSPTNTITLSLRNVTGGANIWSVTLNVSDLKACGTTQREGGWYFIVGGSLHTPNGADSYCIRATLSATTTAVSLWTNGVANNWSHLVRQTSLAAPVAGDIPHIVAEWTAAATKTNRTITMNETATTAYGNAVTGTTFQIPGMTINNGGTLAYGTAAATNYVLRMNGSIVVYSGGTYTIGSVAVPVPRSSTAVLEFSCGADADFGLCARNGSTVTTQGLSRTIGKNIAWSLLTADLAGAGTSATVADDTGWLNGDVLAIATTSKTITESELVTLNADAVGTGLAWTAGVANAHKGAAANLCQAEVVLLTRNVKIRSTNASFGFTLEIHPTAVVDADWTEFQYFASGWGFLPTTTTGSLTTSYCAFRDNRGSAVWTPSAGLLAGGVQTCEHSVYYSTVANAGFLTAPVNAAAGGTLTFNDLVAIKNQASGSCFSWRESGGTTTTLTNWRQVGGGDALTCNMNKEWAGQPTQGPWISHSLGTGGSPGISFGGVQRDLVHAGLLSFRNNNDGVDFAGSLMNVDIASIVAFGNLIGVSWNGTVNAGRIRSMRAYGDTTFAQPKGMQFTHTVVGCFFNVRIDTSDFGTASGLWVTHSTADIVFNSGSFAPIIQLTLIKAVLGSATKVSGFTTSNAAYTSWIRYERYQGTATNHKTDLLEGSLAYETTTVDVSPSLKMTPTSASMKLRSNGGEVGRGFLVFVNSGDAPTIAAKVQKDAAYNGNPPRLMLMANAALGFDTDTVLATCPAGSGSWQTLISATLAAVTDDGVLEAYVDCDGTAGNCFVDTAVAY